jgi:uncharacterized protein
LLPDAQSTSAPLPEATSPPSLLAPPWHTAVVLFFLLGVSLGGARGIHPPSSHGKLPQYLLNMAWEWALTGFIYLGIRKRITLRRLIGGCWNDIGALLRDVLIAAAFWLIAIAVLGAGGHFLHLDEGGKLESMRRELGFLVPGTPLELIVWCLLSITAGICEEIIFRGYLQRQFGAFTRSLLGGLILSAIVFGAAHGYEGGPRMLLVGVYGLLFGVLAWWRKSLRPGMIAHAWHDAFAGAAMRLLK